MSKPAIYRLGLSAFARCPSFVGAPVARSTADAVEQATNEEFHKKQQLKMYGAEDQKQSVQYHLHKTFTINIGADLRLPCKDSRTVEQPAAVAPVPKPAATDHFAGLPLQQLAGRLGEKVAPAFQQAMSEQRQQKREAARLAKEAPVMAPSVPHFLPFTRWAANNETFQKTFVAEDPKERKRARLSWYNPNDGMVPSGWFTKGLLEDLKYYRPFMST